MAVIAFIFGIVVLKYAWRVMVWIIIAPFKIIHCIAAAAERNKKARLKERARRIAAEQRERLRIEQAEQRERREQERREKERIAAERARVKWEWAQEREQERKRAAAWRECCNKSKMGLDYQNAVDDESYRIVRGTELYKLIELYENELFDATEAGNLARIEKAQKQLINTRRLLRENEKAVRANAYNKNKYKAYCSGAK